MEAYLYFNSDELGMRGTLETRKDIYPGLCKKIC